MSFIDDKERHALILSSFNADLLAGCLTNDESWPRLHAVSGGYGQVEAVLGNPGAPAWTPAPDLLFVWTHPEAALASFRRLTEGEQVSTAELVADVDAFAALVKGGAPRAKNTIVATWDVLPECRSFGLLDMTEGHGISHSLMQINLRLAEQLKGSGVYLVDAGRWRPKTSGGANAKRWYMGKIPFETSVFQQVASLLKASLASIYGQSRKLLILDLDDTLWGGIVGDEGWENLKLGGHDPIGEAFQDFQKELKALSRRGILLALASKNEESTALEAITRHPEMILKKEDFVAWEINWSDKAENIRKLIKRVNLTPSSAVFIDDNPVERDRVRQILPEVLVPEWPADKMRYRTELLKLGCFDVPRMSEEDRGRTEMYRADEQREALKDRSGTFDDWVKTLEIRVGVEELTPTNRERTIQLLNKTNQMNLRTRRLSDNELSHWLAGGNRKLYVFSVSDRFGSQGITGIGSFSVEEGVAHLEDFILSCRVMGKRIEETMLHVLCGEAKQRRARQLVAALTPTAKNAPCMQFFVRSGLTQRDGAQFVWDLGQTYPLPAGISLIRGASSPNSRFPRDTEATV